MGKIRIIPSTETMATAHRSAARIEGPVEEAVPLSNPPEDTLETVMLQQTRDVEPSVKAGEYSVPEDFWGSERLQRVRHEAWARDMRPEALLGVVLTRMAANLDPRVVIDDTGKGYAPINLFLALVGPSGAGKTTTIHAAAMMLGPAATPPKCHPATGEGLHAHFRGRRTEEDPTAENVGSKRVRTRSVEIWVNRNGFGPVDEIATLFSKASSHSQTLLSELRAMWQGSTVGSTTKSVENRLSLPEMGYRLSLVAGAQVTLAASLIGEAERGDGTFQRFMFLPAWLMDGEFVDGIAPTSAQAWESPANALWPRIPELKSLQENPLRDDEDLISSHDHVVVTVPPHILSQVVANRRKGQSLDAIGDIGHATYHRLRWAAALAIFDEHLDIRDEDWNRAGMLMELREQVVDFIQDASDQAQGVRNRLEGVRLAQRDAARLGVAEVTAQCATRMMGVVSEHAASGDHDARPGCVKRCFRKLSRPLKEVMDLALLELVETGDLAVDGVVTEPGARYSAAAHRQLEEHG